jgi:DNA-directed RNA polymerase beta subunit
MLKSAICVLTQNKHIQHEYTGECSMDSGGYFIIKGSEKTVLGQERAAENKIFVLTCNRVGTENGFRFIGKSRIIDPTGRVLAEAGDDATVIIAEIDPELARAKRTVNIPDEYELDIMGCRRPELYAAIGRPFLGSTDSEAKGQASVIG